MEEIKNLGRVLYDLRVALKLTPKNEQLRIMKITSEIEMVRTRISQLMRENIELEKQEKRK